MPQIRTCPRCRTVSTGRNRRCGSCGYVPRRQGPGPIEWVAIIGIAAVVCGVIWVALAPDGSETGAGVTPPAPNAPVAPAPQPQPGPSTPEPQPTPPPAGEGSDLKTAIQRAAPSVVRIDVQMRRSGAVGSGFVFHEQGYVLTNHHVVDGAVWITVTDAQGNQAPAELVAADPSVDLALLKAPKLAGTPTLKLSSAKHLAQGDRVVAIGSPEGLTNSVSEGIISALGRTITVKDGATLKDVIQTTAAISHGSSGGPLVEIRTGAVIGITTAGSETGQNLGFAISGDTILARVHEWVKNIEP